MPGAIDSHVHFRDPGYRHKETWKSGSAAAACGGVTTVFEMPNTRPLTTSAATLADKIARANRSRSKAYRPALELITSFTINWCVIACATPAWAKSVFPDLAPEAALKALWQAIFKCTRADQKDPVGAWVTHSKALHARTDFLNGKRYAALIYRGPGTDLTVGLADDHVWKGGAGRARNGIVCNANIPSEEVFTMPHRERVDGTVASTKPLSYQGTFIDSIKVRFEKGRIVESHAAKGLDVFRKMIETDEGAARLFAEDVAVRQAPLADRLLDDLRKPARHAAEETVT